MTSHEPNVTIEAASFRDPAGFVFQRDGTLLRQINARFADEFQSLHDSGLYDELTRAGLLIQHEQRDLAEAATSEAHAVIAPRRLPFVSYPYEWSFSQLQDAALLTLDIQARALARGMTLRDASAYNVQFDGSRPTFIDSLSFARYKTGQPWYGYKQFCEHFLAPLALTAHSQGKLGAVHRVFSDGVPLELASDLLPAWTRLKQGLLLHVHLHASAQRKFADASITGKRRELSLTAQTRLVEHLRRTTEKLTWRAAETTWANYEIEHNYTTDAVAHKTSIVADFVRGARPRMVWDLGANTGVFSRVAAAAGSTVISLDMDPAAVERNYSRLRADRESTITPLIVDLLNPSPAAGWANRERKSLEERGPADMLLALALVHHIALAGHVPFDRMAEYFARIGRSLVVEFVPFEDPQSQRLIRNYAERPPGYTSQSFEEAFARHFRIAERRPLRDSNRVLYLMLRDDTTD